MLSFREMEPARKILTAQEVSECLRISLSTVHHLTRIGKIKGVKMGKRWRYVSEDIDHCLAPNPDISPERRTSRRIQCQLQAGAAAVPATAKNWSGRGVILNLGRGGLLFQAAETASSEKTPRLNDSVLFDFHIPAIPASIQNSYKLMGQIIHLEETGKRRMGIKFGLLPPQVQKAISDYVA